MNQSQIKLSITPNSYHLVKYKELESAVSRSLAEIRGLQSSLKQEEESLAALGLLGNVWGNTLGETRARNRHVQGLLKAIGGLL